jgi:hypothetical protein
VKEPLYDICHKKVFFFFWERPSFSKLRLLQNETPLRSPKTEKTQTSHTTTARKAPPE